jgi:hypothetical protein
MLQWKFSIPKSNDSIISSRNIGCCACRIFDVAFVLFRGCNGASDEKASIGRLSDSSTILDSQKLNFGLDFKRWILFEFDVDVWSSRFCVFVS